MTKMYGKCSIGFSSSLLALDRVALLLRPHYPLCFSLFPCVEGILSTQRDMYKKKPMVSVVIPVYNGGNFLKLAVDSVCKSTYKNFEIILIDDGSTDRSKQVCREFVRRDHRITFYTFPQNRGLGRVLNFALEKARGEYICRINQDDEMDPTRIEKQINYLMAHPDVILVGSWLLVVDDGGNVRINKFLEHDDDIKRTWLTLSPCWDASVMYHKDAALSVGGYQQKYWPADDLHMWYRLGSKGKIANIQEPLVKISFHGAAASVKHHRKHMWATFRVHMWAHEHVEKAPYFVRLFWLFELLAGMIFPARFNWFMYRLIKKFIIYPIATFHVSMRLKYATSQT